MFDLAPSDSKNGSGEAASSDGKENSTVPSAAGWRKLDTYLTIGLLAAIGAAGSAFLAGWIFVTTDAHKADGLALVFAVVACLLIQVVQEQVDNINTLFTRSRRGSSRPATGVRGTAGGDLRETRESPPAAFPYSLDNEELLFAVPTGFAEIRGAPATNVIAWRKK